MKYLVCADIHLNINRRFEDTLDALGQILVLAPSLNVDKVLILGDVYTSRRPHSKEKAAFERWVRKLADAGIEVIILKGNHDEYPDGTHSYSEFTELQIPHVTVHNNPAIVDNFFLGHMLLREAKLGPIDYQHPDAMSTDELLAKFPNYRGYLLGDVHKHQLIRKSPLVVYAGSINRVDFGERNDPKGVLLIDDKDEVGSYKFIELKSRPMIQYDIDLSKALPALKLKEIGDAIVKIIYHGTPAQMKKVTKADTWHNSIRGYCKELIVQHDVITGTVARDERVNESITPQKALELYLEKLGELSPEEKADIFKLGVDLIDAAA
ncbi:hypothetical protein LCGC14_1657790 [marine sediment metagenome]|uniref:Calcineurin-like phosphoesterase domain-containing protein n=1 Tax=marine sediment metagenome TaxID=412755 RepID=A0A0F9KV63_9ZZZZ